MEVKILVEHTAHQMMRKVQRYLNEGWTVKSYQVDGAHFTMILKE